MYSTTPLTAIATKTRYCDRITIRTPQRKIDKNDKTRVRLKVIKAIALRDCKCSNSVEMKRRLRKLGISLDLRLSAAWLAIVNELQWLLGGEDHPLAASIKPQQQIKKPALKIISTTKPAISESDIAAMNYYLEKYASSELTSVIARSRNSADAKNC